MANGPRETGIWRTGTYGEPAYGKLTMANWYMAKRRIPLKPCIGIINISTSKRINLFWEHFVFHDNFMNKILPQSFPVLSFDPLILATNMIYMTFCRLE